MVSAEVVNDANTKNSTHACWAIHLIIAGSARFKCYWQLVLIRGCEVNPIGPRSCYDEGKRCAETLFFDYHRQHGVNTKVVRIFNTYGPRMHPNDGRVVSNFIVQALLGEDLTIFGDGSQTRSFCFVNDLIEAIVRMMNTDDDVVGPVNIGNPTEFTMLQLAELVQRKVQTGSKTVFKPLPMNDPMQRKPDISKAEEVLRWEPRIELEEGLDKTIAYFKKHIELELKVAA